MMKSTTVNNKLMLEPYKGSNKLESKVSSGFATVKQKENLIGLKLLVSATVMLNREEKMTLNPGSIVYFSEEVLYTHEWSKKTYTIEGHDERFIIADASQVILVKSE